MVRDCPPDILLINLYPFNQASAPGDLAMRGFGYHELDYLHYIRRYTRFQLPEQAFWVLLQTHKTNWPGYTLREPSPEELRVMQWLAVGEGASGFFYFHWTSAQTWRGLADNPALLDEVSRFAERIRALEPLLLRWRKADDMVFVQRRGLGDDSEHKIYSSTLRDDNGDLYALVVNRDVLQAREFWLETLPTLHISRLVNVETQESHALDEAIRLAAGEAALFRLSPELEP